MDDPRPGHKFYHPLAPDFIRVLELQPGFFSDPIVGRLVPQPIEGKPYEAVSYVWGDPTKRRDITIDGTTISVTANLHGALTAFRPRPSDHGGDDEQDRATGERTVGPVRRLWADAVCINQEDMPERISQVEQMARIYACASGVLAWLGWEEGEEGKRHTQDAIRFIHSFMRDPEAGLREGRILLEFLHHHHHHHHGPHHRHIDMSDESLRRRFEKQAKKWESVKIFFEIEYFHRTWIVQELGLAQKAIMYTALKPTGGGEVNGVIESGGGESPALELDFVDWPLVGSFVKFLDYSGASLVTHLGLVSWVAHHILMVWETKEDGSPDCDFLTGMHWARILRVTDPRDRVYGLLGHPMAVMDGQLVIKPDYTRTRGVIYTKLAANFIEKTKNLYVVSLVDHEEDPSLEPRVWDPLDEGRMPTWVPDWHSINRTTPVDYPITAAAHEDPDIRIEGGTTGDEGTHLPRLLAHGWVIDEITAVSRRMETTDFPVAEHLARERAKTNPFWLDRVWELVYPVDNPPDRDPLSVLESLSLALPLGTREKDEPVSKAGSNQTLEEHHRSFAAYVLEYHELWRRAAEASRLDEDDDFLPPRSLFDTLPPKAQSELRERAEGAACTGFIECMTWPSMCRAVYRTASGLVGMGSRITRPGDLVCRVRGQSVLMTVRRVTDPDVDVKFGTESETTTTKIMGSEDADDDTSLLNCVHIGPTVVPARMVKGKLDGEKFGEKPTRFRIL